MIGALHEALRSMLYGDGKIPAGDVDITFATPTRDWAAAINRPTINFNLYAIVENAQLRDNEFMHIRHDTRETRRLRPRRIDLRYVVTTHFKSQLPELDDQEWQVLWRVLATLVRNADWPDDLLPAEVRALDTPLQAQVAQAESAPRVSEVFGALGISPRPALHYVLTAPLDLNVEHLRSLAVGLSFSVRDPSGGVAQESRRYAWTLVDGGGEPVVGAEVRLPDGPGFSVSGSDGLFTTRLPHDEVSQVLVRLAGTDDWHLLRASPGEYRVVFRPDLPQEPPSPRGRAKPST